MSSSSVALTINVHEANKAPSVLPAGLEARLSGTPTKSPDDLAKEIEVHTERAARLRQAHIDAVRDRATRETQRAQEAVARKLRLAASRAEKVQRKLDAAESKAELKKEATAAEREARKVRREGLTLAVAEARKAAAEARNMRQQELLEAERNASAKHAKTVGEVMAKGACAVKHARSVAQANKEKKAQDAASLGDALSAKLQAAETRRALNFDIAAPDRRNGRNSHDDALHRVRNDGKVRAEMRKLALEASLAKASEKREAHLAQVQCKAQAENVKAAAVVARVKAAACGTDEATAEAKAKLYDKMVGAEVARLYALRAKYSLKKSEAESVIVVRMDDVLHTRSPPAGLARRLSIRPSALLDTATTRQAAAETRRLALSEARQTVASKATARRAAATSRISDLHATRVAAARSRDSRASAQLAKEQERREQILAKAQQRVASVASKRAQQAAELTKVAAAAAGRTAAAAERHAGALRAIAKSGAVAARRAAFKTRREAVAKAVVAQGEVKAARCVAAAEKRAALLGARVELARKRISSTPEIRAEAVDVSEAWSEA